MSITYITRRFLFSLLDLLAALRALIVGQKRIADIPSSAVSQPEEAAMGTKNKLIFMEK